MKNLLKRYMALLRDRDRGTVAITFLLSLPILLLIVGVITQYALIINARMIMSRASSAAARSAMVELTSDPVIELPSNLPLGYDGTTINFIKRSACMQLESLSPSPNGASAAAVEEGQEVQDALKAALPTEIAADYASRYAYAYDATDIHWQALDDNGQIVGDMDPPPSVLCHYRGQKIRMTITYRFDIHLMGFLNILASTPINFGESDTVAGITGNFLTMQSVYDVELSHGREASANDSGVPTTPIDSLGTP